MKYGCCCSAGGGVLGRLFDMKVFGDVFNMISR